MEQRFICSSALRDESEPFRMRFSSSGRPLSRSLPHARKAHTVQRLINLNNIITRHPGWVHLVQQAFRVAACHRGSLLTSCLATPYSLFLSFALSPALYLHCIHLCFFEAVFPRQLKNEIAEGNCAALLNSRSTLAGTVTLLWKLICKNVLQPFDGSIVVFLW